MKLLYLCHRVPYPPNKGEKIRAYHQLVHIARGHRVHLLCLADTRADLGHARSLEGLCATVDVVYRSPGAARLLALAALASGRPLSVAAFDSRELRQRVEKRLKGERPDLILAYSSAMAQYAEHIQGVPRALDFVDADSEKWRAYGRVRPFPLSTLYALESERLARYEARIASEFDVSLFVSEAEAEIVRRRAPGREIHVIPMGVDLESFQPPPDGSRSGEPVMVFTGVMGYFPNADAVTYFARDILPLIRDQVPNARFKIVGRDPTAGVRRLARLPGVTVTGAVADVRPHLADAALAVAPFRISRGVQSKVLEAMASGLPIVGTHVAFQGLKVSDQDGVRVASSPEALAREVISLIRDTRERYEMGRRARQYVEQHHRWEDIGALLTSTLLGLVHSPSESGRNTQPLHADAP